MFKLSISSPQSRISISNNWGDECEIRSQHVCDGNSCLILQPYSSEAQKIINQNGKAIFPILVITFLSYSILLFGISIDLVPLAQDIVEKIKNEDTTMDIVNDLHHVFVLELVKLFCSGIISLFFLVATALFASEAYSGKNISTKELFSLMKGNKWTRVVITLLCTVLVSICFVFITMVVLVIIAKFSKGVYLLTFVTMAMILVLISYLYMSAIWILSLVVSVLENICGFKAIHRAEKLMKGKRTQCCALMLNYMIGYGAIFVVSFIAMKTIDIAIEKPLLIVIPRVFFICLIKLYMIVMYTVFYQERKKDEGEHNQLFSYGPIDSAKNVSADEEQFSSGQYSYGQYNSISSAV